MTIEQPTSPPDIDEPTAYYRDWARERVIAEALSGPRHEVYDLIVDAIGNLGAPEYKEMVDALYASAQERVGGRQYFTESMARIGVSVTQIVDDYIMSIPRWQDRANDLAWEAWDDDRGAV